MAKRKSDSSFLKPPPFMQNLGIWAGILAALLTAISMIWSTVVQISKISGYLVPIVMLSFGLWQLFSIWNRQPDSRRSHMLDVSSNLFGMVSSLCFAPLFLLKPHINSIISIQSRLVEIQARLLDIQEGVIGNTQSLRLSQADVYFDLYYAVSFLLAAFIWGMNVVVSLRNQWRLDIQMALLKESDLQSHK